MQGKGLVLTFFIIKTWIIPAPLIIYNQGVDHLIPYCSGQHMKNSMSSYITLIIFTLLLTSCQSGYEEEQGKIYYKWIHGGNWTMKKSLLKEADASSFTTIKHNLNIHLGKDKNHVFKNAFLLEHVDPNTFKQVDGYYWKDKNYAYLLQFCSTDCRIKASDPETFVVFKGYNWAKDKNNIYFELNKLREANAESFVVIDVDWGKDNEFYYYHDTRLGLLHYDSAEVVSPYYIKDKDNVYFRSTLVKGANPKTFKADGIGSFGHDDKNMFDGVKNKGSITEQYRRTYIVE